MNLVRFEPWSIVDLMQRDFDRMANRPYQSGNGDAPLAEWAPAVDIIEEKDRFVLRADVPGVSRDDIDVSMDEGVLTIAGERRAEEHADFEGIRRFERTTGRFQRRFTLPDTADAEGISARNANGILEIVIPKQPEVQARRITVEAA